MEPVDFSKPVDEARVYPATHSFRIIADASVDVADGVNQVLAEYEVVSPLERGRSSSAGRYIVYAVSVCLGDRASHIKLDSALRSVPGVKVLL